MRTSLLPAACGAATLSSQYARASFRSNGTTKPTLAPSCTQARRIWASRSTDLASAAGSIAATIIVWASMISPENENVARGALPVRNETARAHQLEAKAVAGVQAMDGPLDGQFQSAVHEKEMMFETQTWRKGIVDARADRQFSGQKLAVETDRRRKPVAGSTHSRCSLRLTSAGASPSMSASRRETVVRCAPARRPSTDAVGLTSPFSIRDREARLTPLSAESSSSDQLRARRNARRRSARRISAASRVWASCSISGRILSKMRASSCYPGGLEGRIACEAVLLQTTTS